MRWLPVTPSLPVHPCASVVWEEEMSSLCLPLCPLPYSVQLSFSWSLVTTCTCWTTLPCAHRA